jgi:predicted nuclease of predicted toxin-antitoxin system
MDPLLKFLNSIAYKFPKGYPDMNNEQDVLILESLLNQVLKKPFSFNILKEELFIFEATDREISTNTAKAVDYIIQNADSSFGFKSQSDKKRLGNPSKIDPEKVQQIFMRETDTFITPSQALEYGICHEVKS